MLWSTFQAVAGAFFAAINRAAGTGEDITLPIGDGSEVVVMDRERYEILAATFDAVEDRAYINSVMQGLSDTGEYTMEELEAVPSVFGAQDLSESTQQFQPVAAAARGLMRNVVEKVPAVAVAALMLPNKPSWNGFTSHELPPDHPSGDITAIREGRDRGAGT